MICLNNLFFSQRKLWNLTISLLKIIIIQDQAVDFIFKDLRIFSQLFIFSLFANEKNLSLIFSVLKIFIINLNKNPDEFEYFSNKIKDLYSTNILKYFKNTKKNQDDFLEKLDNI